MMSDEYSPFGRDPRSTHLTTRDEALLRGELHSYHAEEWIWITGRGYLAIILRGEKPELGKDVLIDGAVFNVRGIDHTSPPWDWRNKPFGILVHGTNKV